jgi:23S rRNA (guanosine2251-2'-O)-methyltransferase
MRPNRPDTPTARQNRHSRSDASVHTYDEGDLASLLEDKKDPLVLILDCVQDPHNLGACLRTADAAGVANHRPSAKR